MSANVESMFSVREKPWHGLGTIVILSERLEDWLKAVEWVKAEQINGCCAIFMQPRVYIKYTLSCLKND